MTRIVVGPFTRVEGDLEISIEVEDGVVRSARVNAPLFRGFEQILAGKAPLDALVFAPRICGICSVAQSAAAARALASAMGVEPPENGRTAANLVQAAEIVADHLAHFHLFFMPDFARPSYARRSWFALVEPRFRAMQGTAAREVVAARARFLEILGVLAGKWPHTLALQPGGTSRAVTSSEKLHLLLLLRGFRSFLEGAVFGDTLEAIGALESVAALEAWRDRHPPGASDLRLFLEIARDLDLSRLGRAGDVFLSYGAFWQGAAHRFVRGVFDGALHPLDEGSIREDVSHSCFAEDLPRHPAEGVTVPVLDKPSAYSFGKAPRLGGRVAEVGALARQVVDGHPLARDLVARAGGNVLSRAVARLLELALLVPEMERWVLALEPGAPFCVSKEVPDDAAGAGLVEAARGALGHWLVVRNGRIHRYQIVAPTTWNFSPRDGDGRPGAVEKALEGTPAGDGEDAMLAQHVVRSFDPCMVCTVH